MRTRSLLGLTTAAALAAALPTASAHAPAAPPTDDAVTRPAVAPSAGAPPSDVAQVRIRHSLLGTHVWYQQQADGLPVVNAYYGVHRLDGRTTVSDSRVTLRGLVAPRSRVKAATAERTARSEGTPKASRLVVLPGSTAKVAYEVRTSHGTLVYVDAGTGKKLKTVDTRVFADAHGQVFDPNPVVSQQNESLTDQNDRAAAVPHRAYKTVLLKRLDNSGYLKGSYARVVNPTSGKWAAVRSTDGAFTFNRSQPGFEQTNAYYAVDGVQAYIRSLGFSEVNSGPQDLSVDTVTDDNSWYDPSEDVITFGTGGVDDAEDQEVVWHEYGHAVQDDQVPGFGQTEEGGAIGEGYGDYLAFTMTQANSPDTTKTPRACVMDWDSTSYTDTTPHCIRRLDTGKTVDDATGEVHDDGEIWSGALYGINKALGRKKANTVILESQFNYAADTDFAAAATQTVDTARSLYGAKAAADVKKAFVARKIL